jgi:hypothetical protein
VDSIQSITIESGNWAKFFGWATIGLYVSYRQAINHISDANHKILVNLGWMAVGGGGNAAWFALSRHMAPVGEIWHPVMFEWRSIAVVILVIIFNWGVSGAIAEFANQSQLWRFGLFMLINILGSIVGII